MKLIALGDNCVDYYHNTGEAFPGGNAINVAVHAAEQGAESEYIGNLATDEMSNILRMSLAERKVSFEKCPSIPNSTTKICSYDVVNGERTFLEVVTGETWAGPIQLNTTLLQYMQNADVIVSGCNAKIAEQIVLVENLSAVFAFDFGEKLKYQTEEYYDLVCKHIDLAMFSIPKMTEKEFEEFCAPLHRRGVVHVLGTMGSEGQYLSNGSKILKMSIHKVNAYDTMGAGDSFLAAFICKLMSLRWKKGKVMSLSDLKAALLVGQQAAAKNCMNQGGFGSKVIQSPLLV